MSEAVTSKKKASPWVRGCGIGCGSLLLLLAVAATFVYVSIKKGLPTFKDGCVQTFQQEFNRAKNDNKLSPEQQEVFGNLLNLCDPAKASLIAIGVAYGLFETNQKAEEPERTESLNAAKDLRDEMKKNSDLGGRDIKQILEKYPKLGPAVATRIRREFLYEARFLHERKKAESSPGK